MQLSIQIVDTEAGFHALEPEWRVIAERDALASPYCVWGWVVEWWNTYAKVCPRTNHPGQLYVIVLRDGDGPVGIFPFFVERMPYWSLDARRLRPLGYSGELRPVDLTEEPLYVVLSEFRRSAVEIVDSHLRDALARGAWDGYVFRTVLDRTNEPSRSISRQGRTLVIERRKPGSQIVALPGAWSEYRKQLSKSMRDNLGYYPRLLRRHNRQFEIQTASGAEIDEATLHLAMLHKQRVWQTRGPSHEDHLPRSTQVEFLRRANRDLADRGEAFVATLTIDGRPAAAQTFLRRGRTLLVGYSGFDPRFSPYSPLFVLQAHVFEKSIESGVTKLDLLSGNDLWQRRWNAAREFDTVKRTAVRISPMPLLRCFLYWLRREGSIVLRRSGIARWLAMLNPARMRIDRPERTPRWEVGLAYAMAGAAIGLWLLIGLGAHPHHIHHLTHTLSHT